MRIDNLSIDEVDCLNNSHGSGVIISWSANIGFGELAIYKSNADEKWSADTECMCNNEDKKFIKMVLNKWVDDMEVH